jgi:hypothetical protein
MWYDFYPTNCVFSIPEPSLYELILCLNWSEHRVGSVSLLQALGMNTISTEDSDFKILSCHKQNVFIVEIGLRV